MKLDRNQISTNSRLEMPKNQITTTSKNILLHPLKTWLKNKTFKSFVKIHNIFQLHEDSGENFY